MNRFLVSCKSFVALSLSHEDSTKEEREGVKCSSVEKSKD